MKRKKRSYQSVFSNTDSRILVIFLLLTIFGGLIFWMKYNKHVDCSNAEIIINADKYNVGEVIEFNNETPNANKWVWDFGDNSPKEYKKQTLHRFDSVGIYNIKLTINGFCTKEKQIEIKDLGELIDQSKIPQIIAPKHATVGEHINFKYKYYTDETFSWEWSFGESGQIDKTDESPIYSYSQPGKKIISLVINGDVKYKATSVIYIKPRMPYKKKNDSILGYVYEKTPESFNKPQGNPSPSYKPPIPDLTKPKNKDMQIAPDVSEDKFELLIYQLANQEKEKEDFAQFICKNYKIPVIANGKNPITFLEFCKQIKGKEINIKSLRLTRDNLNCIDGFSINYKVKKYLIWVND